MKLNLTKKSKTILNDKTNILDVKIPPEMFLRHGSSLGWVNDAFAGGFAPTQILMLTGDAGAGKTTLVLELANSLTAMGHKVLYNSKEESIDQIAAKCKQLNLKSGFTPSDHQRVPELLEQADRMMKEIKDKKKQHFFLFQDSLPTLDDGFYKDGAMNSRTPMRACIKLAEWVKASAATVLFINHVNKDGTFVGKNTVKHAIDAHASLRADKKTGYRHFVVEKNRFGANDDTFILTLGVTGLTLVRKVTKLAGQEQTESSGGEGSGTVVDMESRRRRGRRVSL